VRRCGSARHAAALEAIWTTVTQPFPFLFVQSHSHVRFDVVGAIVHDVYTINMMLCLLLHVARPNLTSPNQLQLQPLPRNSGSLQCLMKILIKQLANQYARVAVPPSEFAARAVCWLRVPVDNLLARKRLIAEKSKAGARVRAHGCNVVVDGDSQWGETALVKDGLKVLVTR
jgi:hypothetical protein